MASRSANFTTDQIDLLLDSLEACPQLVSGKLGGQIKTKHHQKLAWEAVAQEINDIGDGCIKTGDQIRNKWADLKYRVKLKATKIAIQIKESGPETYPNPDDILTALDKRVLSIMGYKSCEALTDTSYDSGGVTLKLLQNLDLVIESAVSLASTDASENKAKGISENSLTFGIEENSNEADEPETVVRNIPKKEIIRPVMTNKILVEDAHREYLGEDESDTENANFTEVSNWPFAEKKLNYQTERSKVFRAKKRKLIEKEEDSFEKKALTTQEKMASDIEEINRSVTEMKSTMKKYMERIDQKFDKMLSLLAIALNVEPGEI